MSGNGKGSASLPSAWAWPCPTPRATPSNRRGIDCRALDGQPTRLLFMIAAPDDGDLHLQILSSLMTLLVEEERRERLVQAATPEAFLAELEAAEA